jgi:peptidoglycan/xylan/chitin deacetylase (PgdA/CDA1 family)
MSLAAAAWGPRRQRAAFSLSFDNLGEAAALQRGEAVDVARLGRDPTADVVPTLLALLGDVPATYFIEASNVARYPGVIAAWHEAGQEVGVHAWRHEHWATQPAAERRRLLRLSLVAFRTLGLHPLGFRPPGGTLPEGALQELREAGLAYCSPLGEVGASRLEDGLAVLPFAWPHVDAFVLDPTLQTLRQRCGAPAAAGTPQQWQAALEALLQRALAEGLHATVIFHPYLLLHAAHRDVLAWLLRRLRQLPELWVASCGDVARSLLPAGGVAAGAHRS